MLLNHLTRPNRPQNSKEISDGVGTWQKDDTYKWITLPCMNYYATASKYSLILLVGSILAAHRSFIDV